MNCYRYVLAIALALSLMAGCNTLSGQPKLGPAQIVPKNLQPGDTAIITVKASDKHDLIARIEGVVVEDPRITFKLNDDGIAPDEAEGDGIWTLGVDVPFQAPPGEFLLEFNAYRSDGEQIDVRVDGERIPLTESAPLVIHYVQE